MRDTLIIGLDIGTTAVKAGLYQLDGTQVDSFNRPYPTQRNAAAVEQNPADWVSAMGDALHQFNQHDAAPQVAAIGITSQVNTHVLVDQTCQPLAPAWVWQDGRASESARLLDAQINDDQRMDWWGAPLGIDASHALARMHYWQQNESARWRQAYKVLLPKDFCIHQLTGEWVSDPLSNIGLVGNDTHYVEALFDLLPGSREKLPSLSDISTSAGYVNSAWPFTGVPVAVSTMDAWAGVFGTGTIREGSALYLSGTSEILGIQSHTVHPTPGVLVMPPCHEMQLHVGPTQSGGASQLWFCQLMDMTPAEMAELAASHDRRKPYPLFLPHLQGERAPLWDATSRGVFIGLSGTTDKAALALAVYDGVACSARWLLDSLSASAGTQVSTLRAGGGGFRSSVWNQLRSDILGVTIDRVAVTDPGVLGAAGLGAVAAGLYPSIDDAFLTLVSCDSRYEPDTSMSDLHAERLALYKSTYEQTRSLSAHWA